MPPIYASVIDAIGNTPLHEVKRIDTGKCRLFLKLENQNPGGSIKDRIGLSMIAAAEADGRLKPGGTIIEATAGNTGIGLAVVASQAGYRLILVVPDKMAQEKIFHLRALGARVIMTRSDVAKGHPDYYQEVAARIRGDNPDYVHVDQFANPANPKAHEETTGPEIMAQLESIGLVPHAIVCGVGSGGTLTGLSRYFERAYPDTRMILADPEGSILAHYVKTGEVLKQAGSWMVEGIGEDFLPPVADLSRVTEAHTISDAESFMTARELLKKEGIIAGSSSGTLIAAALHHCRAQEHERTVVTLVCDSGNKYLSKMFNDFWMADNDFLALDMKGDLRDLIARKYAEGNSVNIDPAMPIMQAYRMMKLYDISQLPVLHDDVLVGLVDEEDVLTHVCAKGGFDGSVEEIMTRDLKLVEATESLDRVLSLLTRGMVAPVVHKGRFQGLITKIDVLNHLRHTQAPCL